MPEVILSSRRKDKDGAVEEQAERVVYPGCDLDCLSDLLGRVPRIEPPEKDGIFEIFKDSCHIWHPNSYVWQQIPPKDVRMGHFGIFHGRSHDEVVAVLGLASVME